MSFQLENVSSERYTISGRLKCAAEIQHDILTASSELGAQEYFSEVSDDAVDYWIDHPIRCGYLLAFCENQYCAENINFIMEIDRYRDFMVVDRDSWGKFNWKQIDHSIGISTGELRSSASSETKITAYRDGPEDLALGGEQDWPSKIISRETVVEHVYFIWNKYLSDSAPHQICIPAKVLINTKLRLEYLHIYGREVFQEALIDPMKTLKRDVLPRFLASILYSKMLKYTHVIEGRLSPSSNFCLASPKDSKVFYFPENQIKIEYLQTIELTELLKDYILYESFLKYLREIVSSENLLCARSIEIFRNLWDELPNLKKATEEIEDMAWTVYEYFVAPGSAFEISVENRRRKQVMQSLASPSRMMFYRIEVSVIDALKPHYENYIKSSSFARLPEIILNEKNKSKKKTCFGV